jgi:hypothetical protein
MLTLGSRGPELRTLTIAKAMIAETSLPGQHSTAPLMTTALHYLANFAPRVL